MGPFLWIYWGWRDWGVWIEPGIGFGVGVRGGGGEAGCVGGGAGHVVWWSSKMGVYVCCERAVSSKCGQWARRKDGEKVWRGDDPLRDDEHECLQSPNCCQSLIPFPFYVALLPELKAMLSSRGILRPKLDSFPFHQSD